MGRGTSKASQIGGGGTKPVSTGGGNIEIRTDRNLYSKEQVDALTKDYTPQMFLGDIENNWTGTGADLQAQAEENMPKTINVGGYTFQSTHGDFYRPPIDYEKNKTIIQLEYQSTEQVGNEYPVLQIGIRAWRTPKGQIKSEIIRDGFIHKTRFW